MEPLRKDILEAFKRVYTEHRFKEIDVHWMTDDELLEVNKTHLDHDYYTDIITFDYSRKNRISGELFISMDRIKDNAELNSVTVEKETDRVLVHGVLHLLGFKDKSQEEQTVMRQKEDEMLEKLGHDS